MRSPECGGYYYKRKGQGYTCPKCMVRMNTKNIKTPPNTAVKVAEMKKEDRL